LFTKPLSLFGENEGSRGCMKVSQPIKLFDMIHNTI